VEKILAQKQRVLRPSFAADVSQLRVQRIVGGFGGSG
jgi:hypothetical protein